MSNYNPEDIAAFARILGARGGAKGKGKPLSAKKLAAVRENVKKATAARLRGGKSPQLP